MRVVKSWCFVGGLKRVDGLRDQAGRASSVDAVDRLMPWQPRADYRNSREGVSETEKSMSDPANRVYYRRRGDTCSAVGRGR